MVLYAITFTVEGAELHLRGGLPSEHGFEHAGAEMIHVRLGDEQVVEL
jgi:hypothetical protein